ncbi:uncharacterized protein LOC135370496 [Ornithodoros turicata]|uniref:uncharacterized protein LOC135370496 n=1 Tax=Ornithodoros turicata TaxID=34597 RepID=UPI00313A0B51
MACVSTRWKRITQDPSLWKTVVIDWSAGPKMEYLLEKAVMLEKLHVNLGSVDWNLIARFSEQFVHLRELCVPLSALADPGISVIIKKCRRIEEMTLHGRGTLLVKDVDVLSNICALKTLTLDDSIRVNDDVLSALCACSCKLEGLNFSAVLITWNATWHHFGKLHSLRSLAVKHISTTALKTVSKNCPALEVLKVDTILEDSPSVMDALSSMKKLKTLFVVGNCGGGWFETDHNLPPLLEAFHVPRLKPNECHMLKLANDCRKTLRRITISGTLLTETSLLHVLVLSNLETIRIDDVANGVALLRIVPRLPQLRTLEASTKSDMADIVRGLCSVVNVTDRSEHGQTLLTVNMLCASQESQDRMLRELYRFKEYLLLNTRLSLKYVREFDEKWWQLKDSKLYWLPCGNRVLRTIGIRFPVVGQKLRRLTLTVDSS